MTLNYDVLLKGGQVLDPANERDGQFDIGVMKGRIEIVEPDLDPGTARETLDMSNKWIMPGHIDSHCHFAPIAPRLKADMALGIKMMAAKGVTTAIDFASTMPNVIDSVLRRGAGINVAGLKIIAPGITVPDNDPSSGTLKDMLAGALREGSLGLKCIGGHFPLTPEATARAIEICNQDLAYVALHCGTTESSSNMLGMREIPQLVQGGRLHVAHIGAYVRGMIQPPVHEAAEALDLLIDLKGQVVSEAHLARHNACDSTTKGPNKEMIDHVTQNCLKMGGYPPTAEGLRNAILDGYAKVLAEQADGIVPLEGHDAYQYWKRHEDAHPSLSFPVSMPSIGAVLTAAKDESGRFIIDAVASDGGYIPRNFNVERCWALVKIGAITPLEMVEKLSLNPARMFGMERKGHLSPGADADVTAVDGATGRPVLGMVAGNVVMKDGETRGTGGILLVAKQGVNAARESGLPFQTVDLSTSKLYDGWA